MDENRGSSSVQDNQLDTLKTLYSDVSSAMRLTYVSNRESYNLCFQRIAELQTSLIQNRSKYLRYALLHCQIFGGVIGALYDHFNRSDLDAESICKYPDIPIAFCYALSCFGEEKEYLFKRKEVFEKLFPTEKDLFHNQFFVVPFFFNVGINLNAQRAEIEAKKTGTPILEQEINDSSIKEIEDYLNHRLGSKLPNDIHNDLERLKSLSSAPYVIKDGSILHLAMSIIRQIDGILFIGCKSAKDRTSMVLTYDQLQLIEDFDLFDVDDHAEFLDWLRINGTTIHLPYKSTGIKAYRFTDKTDELVRIYTPPDQVWRRD
ncbi:hypothetical protein ACOME3_002120 [Neoechinorhynchus agilis]